MPLYKDNKIKQLKAVITVANCKSIKKAAEELGLTSGAISSQISSLEKQVGHELFNRSNNKIEINDLGKKFYAEAVAKLQGIDSFYDEFIAKNGILNDKNIRISGGEFVLSALLNTVIGGCDSQNNDINYDIFNISLEEATIKLINGEVDIILYDIDQDYHPAIEIKSWICEDFVVCSNKKYDLFNKNSNKIIWKDLKNIDLIKTGGSFEQNDNFDKTEQLKSKITYHNSTFEMCKDATNLDLGCFICPKSYAKNSKYSVSISHLVVFIKYQSE